MAIAPLHPARAPRRRVPKRDTERSRTRIATIAAAVGIAAALIAYGLSPGVRHVVGHAEHSVRHAVSNIFDHDRDRAAGSVKSAKHPAGGGRVGAPGAADHGGTPAPVVRRAPHPGRRPSKRHSP